MLDFCIPAARLTAMVLTRPTVKFLLTTAIFLALAAGIAHADTGTRIAQSLRDKGMSPEAIVLIVSMLPVVELRGAIPIGEVVFRLPLWKTLLISIVGNMMPIFLVVLFLERLTVWLSHIALFRRFFEWLFKRTRAHSATIARYEFWGLAIFVGIPLPGTGAWTGAVAAVLMDMPYWRSLLSIFLGVLMAAAVVTLLSVLRVWGLVIACVALAWVLIQGAVSLRRRRKQAQTAPASEDSH